MSSVSDGISWLWWDADRKRRGCPSLQINSARLKAIIGGGGGGGQQEDKWWWMVINREGEGNGRCLTATSRLRKHTAQCCVEVRVQRIHLGTEHIYLLNCGVRWGGIQFIYGLQQCKVKVWTKLTDALSTPMGVFCTIHFLIFSQVPSKLQNF